MLNAFRWLSSLIVCSKWLFFSDAGVVKVSDTDLLVHDYGPCDSYDIDDTSKEKVDQFLVDRAKQIQNKLGKYFAKVE